MLCNCLELEPSDCVFCLLLPLLLLCGRSSAHSICRRGVWDSANTGARCCQNTSEQVGVLFQISISWEANTCYFHLFGMAVLLQPSGEVQGSVWWGMGVFSSTSLSCKQGFEEDDTSSIAELDPCEFLHAALKIYLNEDMARTF